MQNEAIPERSKREKKSKTVTIRMEPSIYEEISKRSKQASKSFSQYVIDASIKKKSK